MKTEFDIKFRKSVQWCCQSLQKLAVTVLLVWGFYQFLSDGFKLVSDC